MADRLTKWPDLAANYSWDEWLDGSIWRLNHGEDFKCKIETIRLQTYKAANERGLKVRTTKDGNSLIVQALTNEGGQ